MGDQDDIKTLGWIYTGQYKSLVQRRAQLVAEIEQVNNNIIKIIRSARKENIDVVRLSLSN